MIKFPKYKLYLDFRNNIKVSRGLRIYLRNINL